MDYKEALRELEELLRLVEKAMREDYGQDKDPHTLHRELCLRYGALEELITRFGGATEIQVVGRGGGRIHCKNYIEAGYMTGRTTYAYAGYCQLLKIIGKVRQLSEDPTIPHAPQSITEVARVLRRFRECCQYLSKKLEDEEDVKNVIWIMLRSHFDRVERENALQRFGVKNYKPDFGIPDLSVVIECKYIGDKAKPAAVQDAIQADVPGYLGAHSGYQHMIVFVYDAAHKLLDARRFIDDLRKLDGIQDVIVVPGIG